MRTRKRNLEHDQLAFDVEVVAGMIAAGGLQCKSYDIENVRLKKKKLKVSMPLSPVRRLNRSGLQAAQTEARPGPNPNLVRSHIHESPGNSQS